jgi:uncharacterized protein YbjT (DUF2867 family)
MPDNANQPGSTSQDGDAGVKVILFGGSGMIGQGVLRECLADDGVECVLSIGRSPTGARHAKLHDLAHRDFTDFGGIEDGLAGYDACFFCLGVSSAGLGEAEYRRVTYDYTVAAARSLAGVNPGMVFIYVSGAGADSSERGRSMWARVKGATENTLLELPLTAYVFRPGYIQPLDGITSRTRWYRLGYAVSGPLYPLLRRLFPRYVTTTRDLGRAMLNVARHGARARVLETDDINAAARLTSD